MIKTTKKILNIATFLITIILLVYGFSKGYDNIELILYNLYFVTVIITQIINFAER